MLTIYPKTDPMDNPWSRLLGVDDFETDIDLTVDAKNAETAQMSPKDTHLYKSCPVWEELIFVKCRYCNCSILPHSIKNHVEMRHTGDTQYEKDPEFSIFRKKPPLPPAPISTAPNPRASSSSTAIFEIPYSRTSTSCLVSANQSPRLAEQFLGWPNSPHGAFQQSPLNTTVGANIVRVKPENKTKVVIPGYNNSKATSVSVLAKSAPPRKNLQELSASVLSPVVKDEPYNQTFSFSAASALQSSISYGMPSTSSFNMPSTSSLNMPSTSSYNMPSTSSQDMPSTSYKIPSSMSRGLLPCQPLSSNETSLGQGLAYSTVFQSPSSTSSAENETQEKAPAIEKLVLRRVLQTDPKEPAERSQSLQGLKGVAKNRKDSSQTYFMVVKNKDRQQNLIAARQQIRKQTNVVHQEKDKVEQKMKKLENHRSKLINKLFQELQSVKQKLVQCNLSKQEIEKELLAVKADLEETKRTTDFQNEALLKQNAKFENEIQILKQRNEDLTNSLEQAQIYRELGSHPWNFADNHMSKQFQAIEEQKLELQRRIEELECESRELKNSSTIERGRFDAKLRQYFKIISELKRRLDAQTAKSEELQLQRDFYEKHLPPEVCFQVKSQLAAFQHQAEVYEIFPGLLTPQPTPPIASPAIPLAETLLTDIQNINYITFQSQMSPESPEVFQQQQQTHEAIADEEVS